MSSFFKKVFSILLVPALVLPLASCASQRERDKEIVNTPVYTVELMATPSEDTTGPDETDETQPVDVLPDGYYFNDYLGTTRENVLNWLFSHEYDDYYLGTPYGDPDIGFNTDTCMRPNGRFRDDYPCMTCTGFVIDVLTNSVDAGQERDDMFGRIENMVTECIYNEWMYDTPYFTDIVNAYFWGAFIEEYNDGEIVTYKFDSIEEMLDSRILRKGDIVYFSPDTTPYGIDYYGDPLDVYGNVIDCHIGFYWGEDHSGEDLFWHSIGEWATESPVSIIEGGSNMISRFASPSVYDYILVVPLR